VRQSGSFHASLRMRAADFAWWTAGSASAIGFAATYFQRTARRSAPLRMKWIISASPSTGHGGTSWPQRSPDLPPFHSRCAPDRLTHQTTHPEDTGEAGNKQAGGLRPARTRSRHPTRSSIVAQTVAERPGLVCDDVTQPVPWYVGPMPIRRAR
jgi:hypothetical protein